jgi:hypothetical protein
VAHAVRSYLRLKGIRPIHAGAQHTQRLGTLERLHRTMKERRRRQRASKKQEQHRKALTSAPLDVRLKQGQQPEATGASQEAQDAPFR